MNKNLLIALISVGFCACQPKSGQQNDTAIDLTQIKEVRIDKNTPTLPLDSPTRDARYIKLETTPSNLIGQISQVLFTDSLVIVIDNRIASKAMAFDQEGNYKYTFGAMGHGPGEYTELTSATITPDKQHLVIADQIAAQYHFYNLDGTFDHTQELFYRGATFEYLTPDTIATTNVGNLYLNKHGELSGMLAISSLTGPDAKLLFPDLFDPDIKYRVPSNPSAGIRKYNGVTYYVQHMGDTVYQITPDRLIGRYAVNITGTDRPTPESKPTTEEYMDFINQNRVFNGNFVETDDYAVFGLYPYPSYPAFYAKNNDDVYLGGAPAGEGIASFFRDGYILSHSGNNTLVTEMSAAKVLETAETLNNPNLPDIQKLLDGLTEDSNPILFLYDIDIRKPKGIAGLV